MFQMNNQKEVRKDGFLSGTWLASYVFDEELFLIWESVECSMNKWMFTQKRTNKFSLWTWECGFKSFLKASVFKLVIVWDRDVNLRHHCLEDDPVNLKQGVKMIQKTSSGPGRPVCLGDKVELGLPKKEFLGIISVKCRSQELAHGWVGDQFCS